jgi:hypothetical protein
MIPSDGSRFGSQLDGQVGRLRKMAVALVPLAALARRLRDTSDDRDAYREAIGFVTDLSAATDDDVDAAITPEPELTGNTRVDALLGALAEHVAFHRGRDSPAWCEEPSRFLRSAWFPVDLPSVRVTALVSSPASFARRGIWIDRRDLDRV